MQRNLKNVNRKNVPKKPENVKQNYKKNDNSAKYGKKKKKKSNLWIAKRNKVSV